MVENGTYEQLMGNMKVFIPNIMFDFLAQKIPRNEKKLMKKAYTAPFPNKDYCIGAMAFPKDIPKGENHPSSQIMQNIRDNLVILKNKSKILIWGMQDKIFPPKIIDVWLQIYPDLKVNKIENAGHFLQEDATEKVIEKIIDFIKEIN